MGRLSICDLPRPEPGYQITNSSPPPHGKRFESRGFACDEDQKCVKGLKANARHKGGLYAPGRAKRLARKLAKLSLAAARTAASSLAMGDFRFRAIGAVWKLIEELPPLWSPDEVVFFTARPEELEFAAKALNRKSARKLIKLLRTRLNRAGAAEADGWLIAFLHGEFEPESGRYVLHFHGLAVGGMVDVLERLRGTRDKPGWLGGGRLNRTRQPITHLAYTISYVFKSFWPCKRIGPVGNDDAIKRNRFVMRIPEPYHSQYLIWLDKQSIADLGLLMKLRVTRSGLQLTIR